MPVSACSTPSTHPALQTGSRPARADDFWSDSSLAPHGRRSKESSPNHRAASSWSDLDVGSSVPEVAEVPRPSVLSRICAAATASSYRRCSTGPGGCCCSSTSVLPWQRLIEMPYELQGTTANSYYWLPHWSRCAPTMPLPHAQPCALTLGAPALAQAQALPPEYVSIVYCTPTEWTPGGKGFEGAACAAGSDYHVLVPSKGYRARLFSPTRNRRRASPRSTSASR